MSGYDAPPPGSGKNIKPFTAHVPERQLDDLRSLVKLAPIAPSVYENDAGNADRAWGTQRKWLLETRDVWLTEFNWRAQENYINSFPNFVVSVVDEIGGHFDVHIVALFSKKADAVPVVLMHGWPGNFLEFLKLADHFRGKYAPENLPYHIIIPDLPGFGYSSAPPLDRDWTLPDTARVLHNALMELGFQNGFIAHGCNLGGWISQEFARHYPTCKAIHLTFCPIMEEEGDLPKDISELERSGLPRGQAYMHGGTAYLREHGTRPSTISLAISASPIALLAWMGEKYLEWSDTDPSTTEILSSVTLFWLTNSMSTSMYPYREFVTVRGTSRLLGPDTTRKQPALDSPARYIKTPVGYSWFPKVLIPTPVAWVKIMTNLVWSRVHSKGGHFPALEQPTLIAQDIEDFVAQVWQK